MAAAFGVAASAIQVADAGFKLYGALSNYVTDYVDANKHARRLADEVRMTSWALQRLGTLLQEDEDFKLCKPEVVDETEAALQGCETAFGEVEAVLDGYSPDTAAGPLVGMRRWKWPQKKDKALLLLAQFERLKTTLLLVFNVLSYASKLASKTALQDASFLDEKIQVSYLYKAKQEAVAAEQKLRINAGASDINQSLPGPTGTDLGLARGQLPVTCTSTQRDLKDSEQSTGRARSTSRSKEPIATGESDFIIGAAFVSGSPEPSSPGSCDEKKENDHTSKRGVACHPESEPQKTLKRHLELCSAAVIRLHVAVEDAKNDLHKKEVVPVSNLSRSLRHTRRAFDDLVEAERDVHTDSEPDDNHTRLFRAARSGATNTMLPHTISPQTASNRTKVEMRGGDRSAAFPCHSSWDASASISIRPKAKDEKAKRDGESWLSRLNLLGGRKHKAEPMAMPPLLPKDDHGAGGPYQIPGALSMPDIAEASERPAIRLGSNGSDNVHDDLRGTVEEYNAIHVTRPSSHVDALAVVGGLSATSLRTPRILAPQESENEDLEENGDQNSDADADIMDELLKKWTTVVV